jgi:regulator of replication initiation timing
MRSRAFALTNLAEPEASELTQLRAMSRRQEFAIEGLTQALARLRRGASALKEENTELRLELDRIRQMAGHDDPS